MSELSPEARALFRAARGAAVPPPDAHDKVRAAIELQVALGAVGASSTSAWLGASTLAKTLGVAALVLATTWAAVSPDGAPHRAAPVSPSLAATPPAERHPAPTAAPMRPETSAATAPAAPAAPRSRALPTLPRPRSAVIARVAPLAPLPTPAAPEPAAPPVIAASEPPAPPAPARATPLAEEVRLVTSARAALREGDGARALAALQTYEQRFPDGAMTTEATAVRVLALCATGRAAEARTLAARWLPSAPRSPLASTVRRSCAFDGP